MTSTLRALLEVFDVSPTGEHRYVGASDAGDRDVIDASQVLAQSIVAAMKSVPAKTVRRASGVFCRPVRAHERIEFEVETVQNGRAFATVIVTATQLGKTCATSTLMLDTPTADVIRHPTLAPASAPEDATPLHMPLEGRDVRLVGIEDVNDPDELGPPWIEAWLRYDHTPQRPDLAKALLAHFTGHLAISTTMRAHPGIGTAMAHKSVSTGVMAIGITFHEPVEWDGWLLYEHESTAVGSGMSYVRGQIRDAAGRILASFTQDGLIRAFTGTDAATQIDERARL